MLIFRTWILDEQGQDLIEYALLAAMVSLAVVSALTALRAGLSNTYTGHAAVIETAS